MLTKLSRSFTSFQNDVVIVAAKRTPIGSFMGTLSTVPAPVLASHAIRAALSQASLSPNQITEVVLGNVLSSGIGQSPTRQAALLSNLSIETISTGINKLCASGLKAITFAAQGIALGHSEIVIAGGMENMSLSPFFLKNYRSGNLMGDTQVIDTINHDGLNCPFNKMLMGGCAEHTAAKYEIAREAQDEFCVKSYEKSIEAWKKGFFNEEVVKIELDGKKGKVVVADDEEVKRVKFDKIRTLKPVFDKNGTITAANASSLNDAACALILMSAGRAKELGVRPLAKIRGFADNETEPLHFGIAPKEALVKAMKRAGVEKNNVDLFEINEAFSAVVLANMKLLDLDPAKVNVNGGAVAMGHPVGMSGARIVATLIYSLKERGKSIGAVGICNGGGGATALVLELI